MTDPESLCLCGDARKDHVDGGECELCRWAPTEKEACREFREMEEKPKQEQSVQGRLS